MRSIPSPPPPILDVLLGVVSCSNGAANMPPLTSDNKIKPKDPRVRDTPAVAPPEEDGEIKDAAEPTSKRPRKEGRVPCKYWMEGKCSKGDACTFNHGLTPNRTPSEVRSEHLSLLSLPPEELIRQADAQNKTLWDTLSSGVCRFKMGQNGSCGKGEACLYSHDLKRLPCRYWHAWGRCGAGRECRFGHDRIADVLRERIKKEAVEAVQRERVEALQRGCVEVVQRGCVVGKTRSADGRDLGQPRSADEGDLGHPPGASDPCPQPDDLEQAFQEELARQLNPFA